MRALLAALRSAEESEEVDHYLISGQPDHRLYQARLRQEDALVAEMIAAFADLGISLFDDDDDEDEDEDDDSEEREDEDWDGQQGVWRSDNPDEDGERDPYW